MHGLSLQTLQQGAKLVVWNLWQFAVNLAFVFAFQFLFGAPNVLAGVAISVGFTTLPKMELGVRPLPMAFIVLALYLGGTLAGQTALLSPWLALPVNFAFVVLILLLSGEPEEQKTSISFLLCFVFCQATAVPAAQFHTRLLGSLVAGGLVALLCLLRWKKQGLRGGRSLAGQIALCGRRRSYILRMAIGISAAMFIGMALHLKKPLWISIVVMSLTQIEIEATFQRIRYRFMGTLLGIAGFVVLLRVLIPVQYAPLAILALGYLSFFTPEYKHKQIVNAISAINASIVLLDPSTAILNRLLCFLGGVIIVLAMWLLEHGAKGIRLRLIRRSRPGNSNPSAA